MERLSALHKSTGRERKRLEEKQRAGAASKFDTKRHRDNDTTRRAKLFSNMMITFSFEGQLLSHCLNAQHRHRHRQPKTCDTCGTMSTINKPATNKKKVMKASRSYIPSSLVLSTAVKKALKGVRK
jgi:hypothetical protein